MEPKDKQQLQQAVEQLDTSIAELQTALDQLLKLGRHQEWDKNSKKLQELRRIRSELQEKLD